MKPDDSSVSPDHFPAICEHAKKALQNASALGRFPTPVNEVMEAAKIIVASEELITESFLTRIRSNALKVGKALKSALSKVLGLFDATARIVYIDQNVPAIRKVFLKLHETGHGVIPWQRDLYCAIEDCEKTISPEISETFDREANCFASEVLFQLEAFTLEAVQHEFGIKVPLKLGKKYGASIYSTIRRYVAKHHRCCVVLVLDPPIMVADDGFKANLRRVVPSPSFAAQFPTLTWPEAITPDYEIGGLIPLGGRKMRGPALLSLTDANGIAHECIAESFGHKYQVFILIHEVKKLTRSIIIFPSQAI